MSKRFPPQEPPELGRAPLDQEDDLWEWWKDPDCQLLLRWQEVGAGMLFGPAHSLTWSLVEADPLEVQESHWYLWGKVI